VTRLSVLVTGSAGLIGGILAERISDEFLLSGFDRSPGPIPGACGDLLDEEALVGACRGMDAIVHLAGASRVDSSWAEVLSSNIAGTVALFEAARTTGVRRVVLAPSNHVVGGFEREHAPDLYALDDDRTIGVEEPIRPDSPYGVSKSFAEAVGRFASEECGMTVICLRIGSVLPSDDPWAAAQAEGGDDAQVRERWARYRATWLSHRDCAGLVAAALHAEVSFAVVYGVSANPRRFWDLEPGRRLLGWWPQDTAPADPAT
jgi:NAD+ dependent glucose-6-phosphate dehydrogenase